MPTRISQAAIQEAIEQEFRCHRCGNCCKGEGIVEFGDEEADRMAARLAISRKDFLARYAVKAPGGLHWLRDQANEERWCIFLELDAEGNYACQVNDAKPDQCKSFPEKWRNPDSFRSCEGLRTLMRGLRERAEAAERESLA